MLMAATKPSKGKVIAALRSAPERDIEMLEPIRKDDLKQLMGDLTTELRGCDHLSVIVMRHKR